MSFEREANQSIFNEEPSCSNQNQIQAEIVTELLRCQKFQEEIVQKINQSKKALHEEEQYVLHQSKKIKEVDDSITASSKVLEQETYERWKFTQNVSNVRDLCQDVNAYSEKTEDVLDGCAQNILEFEKQVVDLRGTIAERKSRIDRKMETPRRELHELEISNAKDKDWYESEKENLLKNIAEVKQKTQIANEASLILRGKLGKIQERRAQIQTQIDILNAENIELESRLLAKQERKQFLFASIENNREYFISKINEMKSALEDEETKLKQITEENETVTKVLKEEGNRNEVFLSEITEGTKQLDYYKQKCLEAETEGKQAEEQFTQEYIKAASKMQDLTNSLTTSEQKLSDAKKTKSQLEAELTVIIAEIQLDRCNIEQIENELSKLQSFNETKTEELCELKESIDTMTTNLVKISNEFFDLTKKLNKKEMKKAQELKAITGEIQELEKQIQEVKYTENAKMSKLNEEMKSYQMKASENLLKQQEREKEVAKYLVLLDKLVKERESVVDSTRRLENELQGVILEQDILLKKVEEAEHKSKLTERKDDTVSGRPHVYKKRDFDETSDSSMEGIISVQEHIKRQRLKIHNASSILRGNHK